MTSYLLMNIYDLGAIYDREFSNLKIKRCTEIQGKKSASEMAPTFTIYLFQMPII